MTLSQSMNSIDEVLQIACIKIVCERPLGAQNVSVTVGVIVYNIYTSLC